MPTTYTYYVDHTNGSDSAAGTTGAPFLTINKALTGAATFASGDTVDVRVRPKVTGVVDIIQLTQTRHGGVTITVEPDVAGTTININRGAIALTFVYCDNADNLTTTCNLTVRNVSYIDTVGWMAGFAGGNSNPAINLTLEDCTGALNGVANVNAKAITFGSSPTSNAPKVTLRRCTFINYGAWVNAAWMGDLTIDNCVFTSNCNAGINTFSVARLTTFTFRNSFLTRTDSSTGPVLFAVPRDCTSINWTNVVVDCSGASGNYGGAAFGVEQFDASTPTNTLCTITLSHVTIIIKNQNDYVLRLGQEDSLGLSKEVQAAQQVNRFGQVAITDDCKFINIGQQGGSGIMIGLGTDGPSGTTPAILQNNYIDIGDPSDVNTFGHGCNLSGKGIVMTGCVVRGYLGLIMFNDNIVAHNNTFDVFAGGRVIGTTGPGKWRESSNCYDYDNIFVGHAPSGSASNAVLVTDYMFNSKYIGSNRVTQRTNRNAYYNVAASPMPLANYNQTNCSTIAQMTAQWRVNGTNPDNDCDSIIANPRFADTSQKGRNGYRPTNPVFQRADGSYIGAMPPLLVAPLSSLSIG